MVLAGYLQKIMRNIKNPKPPSEAFFDTSFDILNFKKITNL